MEAREKAKELFDMYADEFNFDDTYRGYKEQSKQCALIVVDEILLECHSDRYDFWEKVKQEIEKL